MKYDTITNKIKVFISSSCTNEKLDIVRKSLKVLLEETGLFNVFIFEDAPGASKNVTDSYLLELERNHIILFIIDEKDELSSGTLLELERTNILYKKNTVIYRTNSNNPHKKLDSYENIKFKHYNKKQTYPELIEACYKTVLNDVVERYLDYCTPHFKQEFFTEFKSESIDSSKINQIKKQVATKENINIIQKNTRALLSKDLYSNNYLTKNSLCNFIPSRTENPKKSNSVDKYASDFLDVVLLKKEFDKSSFLDLKQKIVEQYPDEIKDFIEQRLNIFETYYLEKDLSKIKSQIENIIDRYENNDKVPIWLINDLYIDYRNIDNFLNIENSKFDYSTNGQKKIDSSTDSIYLPVLDRLCNDLTNTIANDIIEEKISNPYSSQINMRDYRLDIIANIFVTSLMYGSFTHTILSFGKKLVPYLINECLIHREHKLYLFLVTQLLYLGDTKKLEKFLRAYGESTNNLNNMDVEEILSSINLIPFRFKQIKAKILLLKHFGFYFSDKLFEQFFSDLQTQMKQVINEKYSWNYINTDYLEALLNIKERVSVLNILEICELYIINKYYRFLDKIYALILNLNLEHLSNDMQYKWKLLLSDIINNKELNRVELYLNRMLIKVRNTFTIDMESYDLAINKNYPDFYKKNYTEDVFKTKKEKHSIIFKNMIDMINRLNEEQGKNNSWSGRFSVNPYNKLEVLLYNHNMLISSKQKNELCKALLNTLIAEKQTIDAKKDAIELLTLIRILFPKTKIIKDTIKTIASKKEECVNGEEIFWGNYLDKQNIKLSFELLSISNNCLNRNKIVTILSEISQSDIKPAVIEALRSLNYFLMIYKIKKDFNILIDILMQFIIGLSYHDERLIRQFAYLSLSRLLNSNYREEIVDIYLKSFGNETYENELTILSIIKNNFKKGDNLIEMIIKKKNVNNNFLVRTYELF
ncbi:MAG: hypothetical protein ACPKNR_09520 [Pleomorphochaeta sp.]